MSLGCDGACGPRKSESFPCLTWTSFLYFITYESSCYFLPHTTLTQKDLLGAWYLFAERADNTYTVLFNSRMDKRKWLRLGAAANREPDFLQPQKESSSVCDLKWCRRDRTIISTLAPYLNHRPSEPEFTTPWHKWQAVPPCLRLQSSDGMDVTLSTEPETTSHARELARFSTQRSVARTLYDYIFPSVCSSVNYYK